MKFVRSAAALCQLAILLWVGGTSLAQRAPDVRRAQPVDELPVRRAVPIDESTGPGPYSAEQTPEPVRPETEAPDRRRLAYANALFTRKLYDPAIPEYQTYLDDYPGGSGRANAYFSLGECYRNLNRASSARASFQRVLNDYSESEFAGPAAYALAEMAFTEKDYAASLPLFHRSSVKSRESAVALSARYFEARCLEVLDRKEEARAEVMLFAANSQRQLGQAAEAESIYGEIIAKYPDREEAKDARYQRLINIYNSDTSRLPPEVDEFLASNPTTERADQAKLLKAEALYKQQNYARAAPIYAELRASQLAPKLRAESAYKLGWSYIQMKDIAGMVEAFSYFVQAFPDGPQAAAAFAQRALAYQQDKNYDAALSDWNMILTKYPGAHEREEALQHKALILGQQQNAKGMSDTFRQLLKEFPNSPVAAQAQYYIGT